MIMAERERGRVTDGTRKLDGGIIEGEGPRGGGDGPGRRWPKEAALETYIELTFSTSDLCDSFNLLLYTSWRMLSCLGLWKCLDLYTLYNIWEFNYTYKILLLLTLQLRRPKKSTMPRGSESTPRHVKILVWYLSHIYYVISQQIKSSWNIMALDQQVLKLLLYHWW